MTYIGVPLIEKDAAGFQFGLWSVDRCGDEVEPHGHVDAHLMWAIAGAYETAAPTESCGRPAETDILVYNPPGVFHADRFLSRGSFFVVNVSSTARAFIDSAPATPVRMTSLAVRSILFRLARECADWGDDSSLVAESLCAAALAETSRDGHRGVPPWISTACDLLQDETTVSVGAVARAIGVHPTHLIRQFRKFVRCTPGEFARAARLRRAAGLLRRHSIASVALATGFVDQSHFTRLFRRAFGVTPAEYRRTVHGRANTR